MLHSRTAFAHTFLNMSDHDAVPLPDNEEWSDEGDDSGADSVGADGEDEAEFDDTVNAVSTDHMVQWLVAVRESDVVEVEEFSDIFDPQDDTIWLMMQ